MDAENLNQALYDKMSAEQERFRHNLLGEKPEEILNHAYEYAMREDILMEMEELDLSKEQIAALLESPAPLADIYKDFRNTDATQMDVIRTCIEERADKLLEAQREKSTIVPFYQETLPYARAHDEVELWRASRMANAACRDAIDAAIQDGYDGRNFILDVEGVLKAFSPERVSFVLAATLQERWYDTRFSSENHAWAASIPMIGSEKTRSVYAVSSHSTLLEGFVNKVREKLATMLEPPENEKKPSIKAQLAAKPVPDTQTAKPKKPGGALMDEKRFPPVYKQSFLKAVIRGEAEQFRASQKLNADCAKAIDTALEKWFDNDTCNLNTEWASMEVVSRFGYDRTMIVLANTVRHDSWDGRFSSTSMKWAQTMPRLDKQDLCLVSANAGLVDLFVGQVCYDYELEQPLKKSEIKAEAKCILKKFQSISEPNSPDRTKFLAHISPEFHRRAKPDDFVRMINMLPFSSPLLTTLPGHKGFFVVISSKAVQTQHLRKPSIKQQLKVKPIPGRQPIEPLEKEVR